MNMKVINNWTEDFDETRTYTTVRFDDDSKVDVVTKEDGFAYVMSATGGEVYRNADDGFRDLTKEETDEVLDFVERYLKREQRKKEYGKEEYGEGIIYCEQNRTEYIKETLDSLKEWFDVEGFIKDHRSLASRRVLESMLIFMDSDYNDNNAEFEYNLAWILRVPFKEVVKYRTDKFWDEAFE